MVGSEEPDDELKTLIVLSCKLFFGKEIDQQSIKTMDDAVDLVVEICAEAGAARLTPCTYGHYDVKGDPFAVCNTISLLLKCCESQISNKALKKQFLKNCDPIEKIHRILYAFYGRKVAHDYATKMAAVKMYSILFQKETALSDHHATDNVSKLISNCMYGKVGSLLDFQYLFENDTSLNELVNSPPFRQDTIGSIDGQKFICYKVAPSFDRMSWIGTFLHVVIGFYLDGDFQCMHDLISLITHFAIISAGTGNIMALRNFWSAKKRNKESLVFSLAFADIQAQYWLGRNKRLPGNGCYPRYQYWSRHKSKLLLCFEIIVKTIHTFVRTIDCDEQQAPSDLFFSLKEELETNIHAFWKDLPRTKELREKAKRATLSSKEKDLLSPPGISNFQMTILFHCLALFQLIPRQCYEYAMIAENHGPHKLLQVLSTTFHQGHQLEIGQRLDNTLQTIVTELQTKFKIEHISRTIVENILCELHKMISYYSATSTKPTEMSYEEVAEQILHNEDFFDKVFDKWSYSKPRYPDVHYIDSKLGKLCNLFAYHPTSKDLIIRDSSTMKKARVDFKFEFDKQLDDFKLICTASFNNENNSQRLLRKFFA